MEAKRGYIGIDRFRIVAALMVVAIHTGPLLSVGETADTIFTGIICRLGVPFFFAATGHFLLGRPVVRQAGLLKAKKIPFAPIARFIRKTALVYLAAVLLYLPVNLYAGHFTAGRPVGNLLRMIFIDGTMYHLWYLPAAILGVALVWGLLRVLPFWAAGAVSAALYIIGLMGDSWYGLAAQAPALKALYDGIFAVASYTRNGLFYAPLFLMVGVLAARRPAPARRWSVFAGFGACLGAMVAEGLWLHAVGAPRHDSMYLMLPFCLFFLFRWLLTFTGPSSKALRDVSLLVYLLHPMVTVLVRGAAKAAGLYALLVENSLVHYLVVCILSFAAATVLVWLWGRWRGRLPPPRGPARRNGLRHGQKRLSFEEKRAWAEVDMDALAHNLRLLQSLVPTGCRLMPAVKGNAYGCGAVPVARALERLGVDAFCVACLDEGVELRENGVKGEILVLGYTRPGDAALLRRHRLAQTLVDAAHAGAMDATGVPLDVHIKIDTGMHRLGEAADNLDALAGMFAYQNLRVRGVYTQLSASDSRLPEDVAFTDRQITRFWGVAAALEERGIPVPAPHIQCSYGIINYPQCGCAWARPGLALYGLVDEGHCTGMMLDFRPVLAVKARVALVKTVAAGQRVGYGHGHLTRAVETLAIITLGYGDGLPRALSRGAGGVLVGGCYAPFAGDICMDQALVDVSAIPGVAAGDEAVVIGKQGAGEITAGQLAGWANTIPNEVASRLGHRLERITVHSDEKM